MGNTASVEASGVSSKATQKLSKPLTGSPATAGLLNSNGLSDVARRPSSPTGRLFSLTYASATAPSASQLVTESAIVDDMAAPNGAVVLEDCLSPSFIYNSPREGGLRQRSQSLDAASLSHIRHMQMTNPDYMRSEEGYEHSQLGFAAPTQTAPLSSVNYDLTPYELPSYEAERLLNFVEEPALQDQSPPPDLQLQLPLSRQQSYTTSYHPSQSDATALLPQTDLESPLYAPIRRKSLLTPGVATRPSPADFMISPATQVSDSLPPTTAPCGSSESMGNTFLPIPDSPLDPSLTPRAHTPCEADYKQTGAFKHGTLRITNGSPTVTSIWEGTDDGLCSNGSSTPIRNGSYSDPSDNVKGKQKMVSNDSQPFLPLSIITTSSVASASDSLSVTDERETATYCLPELKLPISSFSMDQITGFEPRSPDFQATTKLTIDQDQFSDDGSPTYDSAIFSVSFDHEAKSTPFSPGSVRKGKHKEVINRSDSGVAASPTAEASHNLLTKADSGYSSSVSIRSLSSKQNCQQEIERFRNREEVPSQVHTPEHEKPSSNASTSTSCAIVSPEGKRPASSSDEQSAPVRKNLPTEIPKQVLAPSKVFQELSREVSQPLDTAPVGGISKLPGHLSSFQSSPTPTSILGNGQARKPGLLRRLLSGSRTPMVGHFIHDPGGEAGAPFTSPTAQANSHGQASLRLGSSENHFMRANTRIDTSEPTTVIKTTINDTHSSMEQTPQDTGFVNKSDREHTRGLKTSLRLHSISSTINRAASSVMGKNHIRKPTLARTNTTGQDTMNSASGISPDTSRHPDETSQQHQEAVGSIDSVLQNSTDERKKYGGSTLNRGRSKSMSMSVDGRNPRIYDDALRNQLASQNEQYTNSLQRSPFTNQYSVSGTPPPVSMKTRHMGVTRQLRVPPPIRPQLTPRLGPSTILRSREGAQRHLYNYSMDANNAVLSRRSSRENFYANPTAQTPTFSNGPSQAPSITRIRSSSDQLRLMDYQVLGGNSRTGTLLSQDSSFDHNRRNSFSSQTSQRSVIGNRQLWHQRSANDRPALRHRSSFDGSYLQTRQSNRQENGMRLSWSLANGQTYMPDALSGQAVYQQPRQYQAGGYVSRGHIQHRSHGQYGSRVPYRVLHSYNSPAYRGMPIWSG
ncbi:hypothetical protein GGS21DRAFT_430322 [Xylaria nigripes]|nr:hypothetical protein GGS21DRAFT_430322 [Xylaria nigripes]